MGDFNCKEVSWEEWTTEGSENSWGSKLLELVPLYKGGSKEDPLNYRPVSLTSVMVKVCEKVIKNSWVEYLESNNVIVNNQFGFRKGRSCITNLICFYSRVIDII